MKRRSLVKQSENSWENYDRNFSDLLRRSTSPKRKLRRKCPSKEGGMNIEALSQEISGSSSEEGGNDEENNNTKIKNKGVCLSPVMVSSTKKGSEACGSVLRSTPSGSPILTQNRFSTVRKRLRRPSLLPLSPITPGCVDSISFTHLSHFSIHSNDESCPARSEMDSTPLAMPLEDSDEETMTAINGIVTHTNGTLTDDDVIETVTTQSVDSDRQSDQQLEISEPPSTQELSLDDKEAPSSVPHLNQKGSSWINSVVEKIDENNMALSCSKLFPVLQTSIYDSTKKQKFISGGLAEQFQQVLRQEKSQKVRFQHQIKDSSFMKSDTFQCRLNLKVLSHHKEGTIHILECRVCKRGNKLQISDDFYTMFLQHEAIVEANLNLSSKFTIFPPWKTMLLKDHNFPVLLSVNHIQVDNSSETDSISGFLYTKKPQSSNPKLQNVSENCEQRSMIDCESLLKALEDVNNKYNISIAATVQRIYQQQDSTGIRRWTVLCEDAFGIFFELEVDGALTEHSNWRCLLQKAEGHRVLLNNLCLKGRITKMKSPRLFSLIDSVWNYEGHGLMQVQSSQSQSDTAQSQENFIPPSFCYILQAKHGHSKISGSSISKNSEELFGALNRPSVSGLTDTDVLYQHPKQVTSQNQDDRMLNWRVSICGKVTHCHFSSTQNNGDVELPAVLCIVNITSAVFSISLHNKDIIEDRMHIGDCILLKDVIQQIDGKMTMDPYSILHVLYKSKTENINQIKHPRMALFPWVTAELVDSLHHLKMKKLCNISENTKSGTCANVSGVIRKISHDRSSRRSADCNSKITFGGKRIEVLVEVNLCVHIFVKKSSEQNILGEEFKASNGFIFMKTKEGQSTVFYGEELG